jgi:hypothetical protein
MDCGCENYLVLAVDSTKFSEEFAINFGNANVEKELR